MKFVRRIVNALQDTIAVLVLYGAVNMVMYVPELPRVLVAGKFLLEFKRNYYE